MTGLHDLPASEGSDDDWDDPGRGDMASDTSKPTASYSNKGDGKMVISNMGRDDTRSLKKNERTYLRTGRTKSKRICIEEQTSELLISGDLHLDSNQGVCSKLSDEVASNVSKSVVSLVLSNEHTVLFRCSGVVVDCVEHAARILTSASLVKVINDKIEDHDNLKVEVRHEDNTAKGFLGEYDLDLNIAAVNVENFPDRDAVVFKGMSEISLPNEVVAVGCDIYEKLVATSGELNVDSSISIYHEELMFSTCKISEVCEGGPLFDYYGNFVGINLCFDTERTYFLPMLRVLRWLERCTSLQQLKFPALSNSSMAARVGEGLTVRNKDQFGDLESLGYPEPPASVLNDGVLVYSFEEPFGDIWGKGVWTKLNATVASNIHENIVALASFSGRKRFFSCSGVFIEWNGRATILTSASLVKVTSHPYKIVENLRIEVLFHDKRRVEGELLHYNVHYNVALVSVKEDHCVSQPVKIQHGWRNACDVLAVGCSFVSGRLMAARGHRSAMMVSHDCQYLMHSTCRITKTGIGGPLLDFNGEFIGMNFYDAVEGTPYVPWCTILMVLERFMMKRTVAEASYNGYASDVSRWAFPGDRQTWPNRWHVPKPFWCHPDELVKHEDNVKIGRLLSYQISAEVMPSYYKVVESDSNPFLYL